MKLILEKKHRIRELELEEPKREKGKEIEKDVSHRRDVLNPFGEKKIQKGRRIKVKVPYKGEKELLRVYDTALNLQVGPLPEYDKLNQDEIIIYKDFFHNLDDAEQIDKKIDRNVEAIEDMCEKVNKEVRKFNKDLEKLITKSLDKRKQKFEKENEILEDLNVKQNVERDKEFVIPDEKYNLDLNISEKSDGEVIKQIKDNTYLKTVKIVDELGVSLQRMKEEVRSLDEESLRDILLTGLNSHFEQKAGGEVFNQNGKTDIYIGEDNETVFISECKIWRGKSNFEDAINQLLNNLTIKDRKASLIIFNRTRNHNKTKKKAEEELKDNNAFLEKLNDVTENSTIYKLENSNGEKVKVSLQMFHLSN